MLRRNNSEPAWLPSIPGGVDRSWELPSIQEETKEYIKPSSRQSQRQKILLQKYQ